MPHRNISPGLFMRFNDGGIPAAANIEDLSPVIDTQGYETVCFITAVEGGAANAAPAIEVWSGLLPDMSDAKALEGCRAALTGPVANELDDKVLSIEVHRPAQRYLRARRTSGAAAVGFNNVFVLMLGYREPIGMGPGKVVMTNPNQVA